MGYDDGNGNWIEESDNKSMPIFVNYGVNRIVLDVPVRAPKEQFVKLDAFDKAIESTIDFRNLFKWFRNQEDIENQIKVRDDSKYEDKSLAAVKKAMLAMLEGFEDIRIERRPLAMKVNKNGKSLKIDQLSDGEKCTIALFGDLARRMALANPGKDVNPLEGSGVVLIDELDLHMHTSWQRKVLNVLRDTFPNIQFIITTHSPQILGEMDDSVNLLYLYNEENESDIDWMYTLNSMVINKELTADYSLLEVKANPELGLDGAYAFGQNLFQDLLHSWDEDLGVLDPNSQASYNFDDYYTNMIGGLGIRGNDWNNMVDYQTSLAESIEDKRQQVAGVSSDEELVNMMKYQHAYNAASRYINTIDSMLETLIERLG